MGAEAAMKDIHAVIAALEKAVAPQRDLDGDIALASGLWKCWLSKHRYWNFEGPQRRFSWPERGIGQYDEDTGKKIVLTDEPWPDWIWSADVPEYTASLDAALALLWNAGDVEIKSARHRKGWIANVWGAGSLGIARADAPTAALALCIAALKARAAILPSPTRPPSA